MSRTHRGDGIRHKLLGADHFEPPLRNLLAPAALPNGWVRFIRPKECPGPRQSEAALTVLPDDPGACPEERIAHFVQIAVGNEDDDLASRLGVRSPEGLDID